VVRYTKMENADYKFKNAKGMVITERTIKEDGTVDTKWRQIDVQTRKVNEKKFYWIPISFDEISRAPQLEQNLGY